MNKNIHEILKTWGKNKEELPINNSILKNDILYKTSFPMHALQKPVPTPYPYLSMAFATIAIIVFVGNSIDFKKAYPTTNDGVSTMSLPTVPYAESDVASSRAQDVMMSPTILPYYYPQDNVSAKDTREFLKTYYNATLKTRKVDDTVSKVEVIVRGFEGRIDSSTKSDDSGYVSFVVPATKFEAFRAQVKGLVGKKLIVEQTTKENFLPQKQSLEEQKTQTENSIASLKKDRADLIKNHNNAVSKYNNSIKTISQDIVLLETEWPNATPERRVEINAKISELQAVKVSFKNQLSDLNTYHQNQLASIDGQIKNAEDGLNYIAKADTNLMDNVATVNGTISLEKTNLWEISDIYTPGPLLAWLLVLAALLAYLRHKRKQRI